MSITCESCGSDNLIEYHGSVELIHEETGNEVEIEINGYECKKCAEITVPDEEAERIFDTLNKLTEHREEIDLSIYE